MKSAILILRCFRDEIHAFLLRGNSESLSYYSVILNMSLSD